MKSILLHSDILMSGKISSQHTILFSDIFNLFRGTFDQLIQYFENDYCVINYARDGFTEDNDGRILSHKTVSGYADDLIDYLEEKKVSNVTYIAHSVNALLAFTAAIKAPHLFGRLVVTSGFSSLYSESESQHLCGLQAQNAEALFDCLMTKGDRATMSAPRTSPATIQLTDIFKNIFSTMNYSEAKSLFLLLITTNCRSLLRSLTMPVIILQVAADQTATNEAGYFMYRTIPDSQLIRIRAKGQLPQVDAPEEIVQAMKFFINSPL